MKFVLFLCLVAIFVVEGSSQCPPVGYYASKSGKPNVYCYCQLLRPPNGYIKYKFTCTGGYEWDQLLKQCVFKFVPTVTTTTSTTTPNATTTDPTATTGTTTPTTTADTAETSPTTTSASTTPPMPIPDC